MNNEKLATALAGSRERGHIYVVEPTGPFEDDPNVTNKKFPGNVTQSYRTPHPVQVLGEVENWEGHATEVLNGMLENLARLPPFTAQSSCTSHAAPGETTAGSKRRAHACPHPIATLERQRIRLALSTRISIRPTFQSLRRPMLPRQPQ